ncbi:SDR family oxidoreductase [Streptomyces sp. NPDC090106]|uniref:SDR family oxidoreductase n=1 Tax=Streptomyces sp. NPDC090106 TaxID=3365946 RepID=UPI003814AF6D
MKVLATCATGGIGSVLVPALVEAGHEVSLLTRSAAKAKAISPAVDAVEGSMTDFAFMKATLAEYDALVLIGTGELELVGNLYTVEAAQHSSRLQQIVYIGGQALEEMRTVPTVAPKLITEWALADGDKPYTSLRPSTFMQNDLGFGAVIAQGTYPGPFGDAGVARVDLRDVADAVVVSLGNPDAYGQVYTVCGPDNLTGEQIAGIWSEALGTAVNYAAFPLDMIENGFGSGAENLLGHSIRRQFDHYHTGALRATEDEVARLTGLLGHRPRSMADFAEETALAWEKEPPVMPSFLPGSPN